MAFPTGGVNTAWPWAGDNIQSPSESKQRARDFPPIITHNTSLSAITPYPDFRSTPQLYRISIPQKDISPSSSCTTTDSPHSASDSMDLFRLGAYETGSGSVSMIQYSEGRRYLQVIETGSYLPNSIEDNVFQGNPLDSDFPIYNAYYEQPLQSSPDEESYDDLIHSPCMAYTSQTITSYPGQLLGASDLDSGDDIFDGFPKLHSFVGSTEVLQRPPEPQQQKFRAVGSPAIARAALSRRQRPPAFRCFVCNSTFTAQHNLKNHMNSHLGLKPHTCQNCQRTFVTKHVLKRHRKTLCKEEEGGIVKEIVES